MGSLSSVIAPIASFGVSTALSAGKYIFSNTDKINQSKELSVRNKQIEQNAKYQKQQNLLSLQTKETDRINKLRRAIATQRANFGAQGVGGVTGSADSVLQGINENSDIERQGNFAKTNLDNQGIDQNTRTQKQLNLLQKQQLQQKSAIGFLSGLV